MSRLIVFLALLVLAGCTARQAVDFAEPAPGAQLQTVFVTDMRAPDPNQPVPGRERSETQGYGRYVVAIPPGHQPGRIDRPRGRQPSDPQRHFTLADHRPLDAAGFRQALSRALADQPHGQREVVIFVHGFNTTFIEGVYRVAQLGSDLRLPGVLAHYSWPSMGAPLAYAHDRDSALFARDGLQRMIEAAGAAGAHRVVLIAHSMGAHLVMETLRQMALDRSLARAPLGGVILISPDLDVDVFRSQARRIGRLPQPFLIVASQTDRVLRLSARLTGQPDRLGNLRDPARLAGLDVTLMDVSAFGSGDGHFSMAESPALIQLLSQIGAVDAALSEGATTELPLIPGTILTLQTTTGVLLNPLDAQARRVLLPWLRPRTDAPQPMPAVRVRPLSEPG